MNPIRGFAAAATLALASWCAAPDVAAQGLFAPAASVDGFVITRYEVTQRARFLALIGVPGASEEMAREMLVDEQVQTAAARAAGIAIEPEALDAAMVEFAARADLTPEQFTPILEARGVAPETFRDFVGNGLLWRALVRDRFGARARPAETEVRGVAARDGGAEGGGPRATLSEIALPLTPQNEAAQRRLAETLAGSLRGEAAFARAAARYSAAPTAAAGGRLPQPVPLSNLPPDAATRVLTADAGTVVGPIDFGAFLALFLVRGVEAAGAPAPSAIDYAEWPIPGGRTAEGLAVAAALRARVDTCDDLYGVAKRSSRPETLRREVVPADALPADLRAVLAALDEDEVSTVLSANGVLRFVMLCERVADTPVDQLEAIGQAILSQRLVGYAQGYAEELKADAVIERF